MDNTGLFYLTGSSNGNALLWDGSNLIVKGTIKVGDGTEVTATTVTKAGSALQNSDTGKTLGLDGGSVGGVTIAPTKIYVGTGTYGNANTGFYVDSSGNMSLKDKLTWDNANSTLSITGTVVITGGSTKTAIEDAASAASSAATAASTAQTTANGKVSPSQVTSHIGGENVTTIDGGKISALYFYGKTAQFNQGDIGGWTINSSNINKIGSTHTMTLDSTNNAWRITENANSILRLTITGSTTIPAVSFVYTDTLDFTYSSFGANRYTATANSYQPYANGYDDRYLVSTGGRSDGPIYTGNNNSTYAGIIYLENPTEEFWIDDSQMDWAKFFLTRTHTVGGNGSASQRYKLYLRVRKYANFNDAYNQTNLIDTYTKIIADTYFYQNNANSQYDTDTYNINGTSIQVNSSYNWFRVDLRQIHDATAAYSGYSSVGLYGWDFNGTITVRFGKVNNGYSLFGPGGLQVYQGFRNYMNASTSGTTFFQVKGSAMFESGLFVSGTFDATSKQFKITHPLNKNKWLYHTSTEAPRADLIYRGVLELQNGAGSASIDSSSNMTIGTFDVLTKNPQLFLQNNESFDRIKGYVQSGSVYVLSENQNSTASIDWSVIAERNDSDLLSGKTYLNGKYQTERYKTDHHPILNSGSI
jgi:hypothetical protein